MIGTSLLLPLLFRHSSAVIVSGSFLPVAVIVAILNHTTVQYRTQQCKVNRLMWSDINYGSGANNCKSLI